MTCSFEDKLILYADLESKRIIKYHAVDLEWQCRFAGYFCYRGIVSFENYPTLVQYDQSMGCEHRMNYLAIEQSKNGWL